MRAISPDALLLVDKPAGITSHDVVALARRALGTRKIGHGGTLDPFATGLLLIMVGRGTRLLQFVPAEPKVYDATIRFGTETDTDDRTGIATRVGPPPDPASVHAAITALTGDLLQLPPAYSAKHVAGERAYALARRGERPQLAAAKVRVDAWERVTIEADLLRARISCGTGTYIRSLARDLGRALGSAAHLEALRRVRVGRFAVEDANSLDDLRGGAPAYQGLLEALGGMPRDILDSDGVRRVQHGRAVPSVVAGHRAALIDDHGTLVAVATRRGDCWHPDVVLSGS